jgi:hypothetical protein
MEKDRVRVQGLERERQREREARRKRVGEKNKVMYIPYSYLQLLFLQYIIYLTHGV